MRRVRLTIVSLLLVAIALGGCGDDEEALSKEEWIEQADAICKRTQTETDEASEAAFGDLEEDELPNAAELEEFVDEVAPDYQEQIDRIRDLNPPEDIESDVDEMLDKAQEALDDLESASGEDVLEMISNEDEDPFAEVEEIADELGMKECAE